MKKTVLDRSLRTALWTALVITLGVGASACSNSEEEILAVDRVEQAADIARQNAPQPEDMDFPETAPMVVADVDMTDAQMTATADVPAEVAEVAGAVESEDLALEVGAQIYNKQCTACHATGLLGSPKYGDASAWAPRIAKGKETLYNHAVNGFNQMNAQVNAEVNADQVHAAVDYMVAAAS